MHSVLLSLAMGLGFALSLAPSSQTSLSSCLSTCDAGSKTDQATCRLQCRERDKAKTTPDMIRWKRTELKGGSPDPKMPRGSTTTVETTTPQGTTTRTTRSGPTLPAPAARPRPRLHADLFAIADCQLSCNVERIATNRATCKLMCLQRRAPPAPPRAAAPPASRKPPARRAKPKKAADPACRDRCARRASSCKAGCVGPGSNRRTCQLQCEQNAGSCARRC